MIKKLFSGLMVAMMLISQSGLGLVSLVHAEEPDSFNPADYSQFTLAEPIDVNEQNSCKLPFEESEIDINHLNTEVYPNLPAASENTYAYVLNIADNATNVTSTFFYYGNVEKSTSYRCLAGELNQSTNKCDIEIKGCLVGEEYQSSCITCNKILGGPGGDFDSGIGQCKKDTSIYDYQGTCGRYDYICQGQKTLNGLEGTRDGSTIYYCNSGDSYNKNTQKCSSNAFIKDPKNIGSPVNIDTQSVPAVPSTSYIATAPEVNNIKLPNISPSNTSGYDVRFHPLNINSLGGVIDPIAEAVIPLSTSTDRQTIGSLGLPEIVTNLVNSFTTTSLVCGLNSELPTIGSGSNSCNLSDLGNQLTAITSALGNSALNDFGSVIGGLGGIAGSLATILPGLQNGTLDPSDLEGITDGLSDLNLPDFSATADNLRDLATALSNAQSCLTLLGTNISPLVTALNNTANSLDNLSDGFNGLTSAITDLQTSGQAPSHYIQALSDVSNSLAGVLSGLANLQSSWQTLASSMNGISLPGGANLGALAPVINTVADILNPLVGPTQQFIAPLTQAGTILGQLADLSVAIETNNTNGIMIALDALSNTTQFSDTYAHVLDTLAALGNVKGTLQDIFSSPVPARNIAQCSDADTYKTDMIAYLDNQITLYTQLKSDITSLDAVNNTHIGTSSIDTIIDNLANARDDLAALDINAGCTNLADIQSDIAQILSDAQGTIAALQVQMQQLITDLKLQGDNIVAALQSVLNNVLGMIPGLTEQLKDELNTHINNFLAQLQTFASQTYTYILAQQLPAPTLTAPTDWCLASQATAMTLTMDEYNKANEVWAYVAIITDAQGNKSVSILPRGQKADLSITPTISGNYTVDLRTLGLDGILNAQTILEQLDTLHITDARFGHLQAFIDRFHDVSGNWTLMDESGELTTQNVIAFFDAIDELRTQTSLQGKIAKALFNPSESMTVTVADCDEISPVVTLNGNANISIVRGGVYTEQGATWTDNVDGSGIVSSPNTGSVNTSLVGTYVLQYSHTDHAGNISNMVTRTVTITSPGGGSSGGGGNGGGGGGGFTTPTQPTEIILSGEVNTMDCSITDSTYSDEQNSAYLYACGHDITTMKTVQTARVEDKLTRAEFAKMISNYTKNILKREPNSKKLCKYIDLDEVNEELAGYAMTSCQYNLMGINMNDNKFLPNDYISRAEVTTILSRLYDLASDGNPYYIDHMAAMKAKGFITLDAPHMLEVRGYIFIMLERIAKKMLNEIK